MRKRVIVPVAMAAGLLISRNASAQFGGVFICPTCSSETTQVLNHAELLTQIQHQIQQIQIALQMYQQIMADGTLLDHMQWGNFIQDIDSLGSIIQQGQGLSYQMAALDQQFRAAYPGFADSTQPFYPQYQSWHQTSLDTTAGTLAGLNIHAAQLAQDGLLLDQLHQMAESAIGQDQAVQVGTLIADQEVQQLQKLRQLMMTQTGAIMVYQGQKENQELVMQQQQQDGFGYGGVTFTPTN